MSREARRQANLSLQSGFRHHDMLLQQELFTQLLKGREKSSVSGLLDLDAYAHVLAPEPLRAMKNSVICLITIIARMAISLGISTEKSFALSDYFVYTVEKKNSRAELEKLIEDILASYSDLLRTDSTAFYPQKITKAIRYIHEHIYESCTVASLAEYLHLNPRYFSTLFKNEVGISPSAYIRQKKLEEAYHLVTQHDMPLNEIAELLGFYDASHFSADFKRMYGKSPQHFRSSSFDMAK